MHTHTGEVVFRMKYEGSNVSGSYSATGVLNAGTLSGVVENGTCQFTSTSKDNTSHVIATCDLNGFNGTVKHLPGSKQSLEMTFQTSAVPGVLIGSENALASEEVRKGTQFKPAVPQVRPASWLNAPLPKVTTSVEERMQFRRLLTPVLELWTYSLGHNIELDTIQISEYSTTEHVSGRYIANGRFVREYDVLTRKTDNRYAQSFDATIRDGKVVCLQMGGSNWSTKGPCGATIFESRAEAETVRRERLKQDEARFIAKEKAQSDERRAAAMAAARRDPLSRLSPEDAACIQQREAFESIRQKTARCEDWVRRGNESHCVSFASEQRTISRYYDRNVCDRPISYRIYCSANFYFAPITLKKDEEIENAWFASCTRVYP